MLRLLHQCAPHRVPHRPPPPALRKCEHTKDEPLRVQQDCCVVATRPMSCVRTGHMLHTKHFMLNHLPVCVGE